MNATLPFLRNEIQSRPNRARVQRMLRELLGSSDLQRYLQGPESLPPLPYRPAVAMVPSDLEAELSPAKILTVDLALHRTLVKIADECSSDTPVLYLRPNQPM